MSRVGSSMWLPSPTPSHAPSHAHTVTTRPQSAGSALAGENQPLVLLRKQDLDDLIKEQRLELESRMDNVRDSCVCR